MKLLTLKLALTFIAATIVLTVYESNSCSAQNTKTSPTVEEIDGNAIESIELVEGESKKLNYQQPIPLVYLGVPELVSTEFISKNSFVVTGEKIGVSTITIKPLDQKRRSLMVNIMPDMTRRRRTPLKGDKEQRKQEIDNLIDSLADLDAQTVGIRWTYKLPEYSAGNIPKHVQAMTKLVEMGEEAIPQLLDRMSDETPTKLSTEQPDELMCWSHSNQYPDRPYDAEKTNKDEPILEPYQLKIGDVCFVLIGRIVNRPYHAISGENSFTVNSPVHTPELKQLAVADWQDLDAAKLKASLLKDLKSKDQFRREGAADKLDYYFPIIDDIADADSN